MFVSMFGATPVAKGCVLGCVLGCVSKISFFPPLKFISASPVHNFVAPCLVPHRWRRDAFWDAFWDAFQKSVFFSPFKFISASPVVWCLTRLDKTNSPNLVGVLVGCVGFLLSDQVAFSFGAGHFSFWCPRYI